MLEHIILHNMSNKLNDILIPQQHGFRKGLSCVTQLLSTTQTIMQNVDNGGCEQAAVLDFSKAFDKVSHFLLLGKLVALDFNDNLINWILDFLTDRKQRVVIQGCSSSLENVTSGVPQGSVLGPALFLIYINDICRTLTSTIRLFADDALLHCPLSNCSSFNDFQDDLSRLEEWANNWNMSFNTKKCSIVIFGKPRNLDVQDLNYRLGGTLLTKVESFKYLGVLIDNSFKWGDHVSAKHSEALKTLGMLRRNLMTAPVEIKALAYKTLCRPKVEYAAEVWDPYFLTQINLLESLQNKATRFNFNLKGRHGVTKKSESLELESLQSRRKAQRFKTFYKILENPESTPLKELNQLINSCFNSNRPDTRAKSQGLPLALASSKSMFLNSFITRTTRDMRGESNPIL